MKAFGSRAFRVGKEKLTETVCSYCQTKGGVEMYIFSRYYHFLGIPFYPHRKGGAIMCNNCKHITHSKQFSLDITELYKEIRNKFKAPLWQYFGTISVSALFIVFLIIKLITYQTVSLNKFMTGIRSDNIYRYSLSPSRYTFWKVTRTSNDSIYIISSNYEFSGATPSRLNFGKPGFFDSTEKLFLKSDFRKEFEDKKIKRVR
ncbi:MAG TPA: hypothetical protein VFN30_15025 [Chitinophagaceae bacterium]|nr:hypothetical protein [Chitinophagaceae bacterium]